LQDLGYDNGVDVDLGLLGCYTMSFGKQFSIQRFVAPPSSGLSCLFPSRGT